MKKTLLLSAFSFLWVLPHTLAGQGVPSGHVVSPVRVIQTADQRIFADFGRAAFGTVILQLAPEQRDTIILRLGEKALPDLRVDPKPGGTIRYQEIRLPVQPGQSDYPVGLKPDQRNTNPPAIPLPDSIGVIMPFRYCEILNPGQDPSGLKIFRKEYYVPFNDSAADFTCSDTILNQVWDLSKYTIKATTFCGYYVDGDRERIPYEADALINQLSHYSTDASYEVARRTNEYFIGHPTWPTEWILHTVPLFYYDYMYTGDPEPVLRNWEALRNKTLVSLAREDGLISTRTGLVTDELMQAIGFANPKERIRDIVDWPDGERDGFEFTDFNTVVNAFYYWNLILMAELSGYLQKDGESGYWKQKAREFKKSFNRAFLDRGKGIYRDGEGSGHHSLHANLFALRFGLVPDRYRPSVIRFIKSKGMACSVYAAQYLLEALFDAGEAEYAITLMNSTGERSWWNMIRSGSTMTMEAWDAKFKPNLDWNHAWGAAPANIIPRCLWGIVPTEPGFKNFKIKPRMGPISYSKIKVPTPKGTIQAEYRKLPGKKARWDVSVTFSSSE
jgi:hypothetical protein